MMVVIVVVGATIVIAAAIGIGLLIKQIFTQSAEVEKEVTIKKETTEHNREDEEEEERDIDFTGRVEIEQMGQMIKGNLSYNHHHETLKHTLDKEKVQQHHETSRLAITISGIVGVAVVIGVTAYGITKTCRKQKHLGLRDNQNILEMGTMLGIPKKDEKKIES